MLRQFEMHPLQRARIKQVDRLKISSGAGLYSITLRCVSCTQEPPMQILIDIAYTSKNFYNNNTQQLSVAVINSELLILRKLKSLVNTLQGCNLNIPG